MYLGKLYKKLMSRELLVNTNAVIDGDSLCNSASSRLLAPLRGQGWDKGELAA